MEGLSNDNITAFSGAYAGKPFGGTSVLFGITLNKPIKGQQRLISRIARNEGLELVDSTHDAFVVRDRSSKLTEDEVWSIFDTELSDIGLGISRNSVKSVSIIWRSVE